MSRKKSYFTKFFCKLPDTLLTVAYSNNTSMTYITVKLVLRDRFIQTRRAQRPVFFPKEGLRIDCGKKFAGCRWQMDADPEW